MLNLFIFAFYSSHVSSQTHYSDYEDNIAMESFAPKSFRVPQTFSGFLHRTGELFSDSDYGSKISAIKSDEKKFASFPGMIIRVDFGILRSVSEWKCWLIYRGKGDIVATFM